jgi:predicted DNA-binding transcriptional regulator YafY
MVMGSPARCPLARIAFIDRAIRAGGWPNAATLARELEVSPRTVQRDIVFLRDRLQAPIEFDAHRHGYHLSQPGFRLPFFQLSEGELVALFLAERLLQQYRGTYFEIQLEHAFAKMLEWLPAPVSIDLSRVAETLSVTPTVLTVQDVETFRTISRAVLKHRCLEIDYWAAWRNEETRRKIDPYHLTLIENDWYLIAYCHFRQEIRMFAAVRIRSARETGDSFRQPADFQIDSYLGASFRALRGYGRHKLVLRFTPDAAGRAGEKVWHKSQTSEVQPDGGLLLRMELSDLREVKRWILSWGSECEVLEPEELRGMIRQEIAEISARYKEANRGGSKLAGAGSSTRNALGCGDSDIDLVSSSSGTGQTTHSTLPPREGQGVRAFRREPCRKST